VVRRRRRLGRVVDWPSGRERSLLSGRKVIYVVAGAGGGTFLQGGDVFSWIV